MADPRARFVLSVDDKASKALKKVRGELSGLDKSLRSLSSISLGGAIGVGGFQLLAERSIAAADAIGKTADKLGLSVEALQEYRFAAEQSGIGTQTFDTAIQRLGRRLADADNGTGEAVKAFEELGVSTRNSAGQLKTIDEILPELADRFSEVGNQIDRNRLAQKLFDSEGVSLVNLLRNQSDGLADLRREAREAGLVLSEDLVRGAEDANDQLNIMKRTVDAQFTRAFLELAPAITSVSNALAELSITTGRFVTETGQGLGYILGELVGGGNTLLERRRESIERLQDEIERLQDKQTGFFSRFLSDEEKQQIDRKIDSLTSKLEVLKESLTDPELQSINAQGIIDARAIPSISTPRVQPVRPVETDAPARNNREAVRGLTDAQKAYNKLLLEGKSLTESLFTPQERYAAQIAQINRLRDAGAINQVTYNRAVDQYQQALDEATGAVDRFARLQQVIADVDPVAPLLDQLAALEELQAAFPDYADIVAEAMFDVQEQIDEVTAGVDAQEEEVAKLENAWAGFGDIASSAFEDAIVSGENLSDVVKGIEQDLIRLVTRNLVTNPIADLVGGFFSDSGSGGSFLASLFGGARAMGGPVSSGKAYLVGEQGPELFVPRTAGTVMANGATGNTYNFTFALPADTVDYRRAGAQVAREAARQMQYATGAV